MKITQKQILEACAQVDKEIRYLNSGGCGVFAYFMGSILEKFENCKVRIKVKGYDTKKHLNSSVPENNTCSADWERNGIYFGHIALKIKLRGKKAFLIDSEGLYKDNYLYKGSLPVKYLLPIVKISKGWNSKFKRENITQMLEIIEDYFKDILVSGSPINLTDWELGKTTLPPSMPKSAASKIEFYKDNRQAGVGIVVKLKQGLKFASGNNIAYPANVKDAIALMRKVA